MKNPRAPSIDSKNRSLFPNQATDSNDKRREPQRAPRSAEFNFSVTSASSAVQDLFHNSPRFDHGFQETRPCLHVPLRRPVRRGSPDPAAGLTEGLPTVLEIFGRTL